MDAQPLFTSDKPKKRNNNFGGALSGPVLLPRFNGKDRTFFFVDYERNMQRSEASLVNSVPTPAMLSGDFSTLGTQLINPFTQTPFAGNRISPSLFNPVSQNILNTFFPAPTTLNPDPLDPTNNYLVNIPQPITTDLYDIRIDQKLSDKQSISDASVGKTSLPALLRIWAQKRVRKTSFWPPAASPSRITIRSSRTC